MAENGHAAAFRKTKLQPDEQVVASASGYIGTMMGQGKDAQHNGALVVTNTRVAFYRKGFFGEVLETIPLRAITSIEQASFLGHRVLRMHTSHDALEFKCFEKDALAAAVVAIEDGRRASGGGEARPSAAQTAPSALEKLKQLGELKAAGIISEAEFDAKKAELLAQV